MSELWHPVIQTQVSHLAVHHYNTTLWRVHFWRTLIYYKNIRTVLLCIVFGSFLFKANLNAQASNLIKAAFPFECSSHLAHSKVASVGNSSAPFWFGMALLCVCEQSMDEVFSRVLISHLMLPRYRVDDNDAPSLIFLPSEQRWRANSPPVGEPHGPCFSFSREVTN